MTDFVNGINTMACVVAGLFFLRFWKQTGDRLFAGLATAFALFAVNWIVLVLLETQSEFRPLAYLIRLIAFLIIIAAILDKNLSNHRPL